MRNQVLATVLQELSLQIFAGDRPYYITMGSSLLFPRRSPNAGLLTGMASYPLKHIILPSSSIALQPTSAVPNDPKQKPTNTLRLPTPIFLPLLRHRP